MVKCITTFVLVKQMSHGCAYTYENSSLLEKLKGWRGGGGGGVLRAALRGNYMSKKERKKGGGEEGGGENKGKEGRIKKRKNCVFSPT